VTLRVVLSRSAADYVRKEAIYLRQRHIQAARNFLADLRRLKAQLSAFPQSGPSNDIPGFVGTRKIVMGDHVIFYEVGAQVSILTIRHGRQLDTLVAPDDNDPER